MCCVAVSCVLVRDTGVLFRAARPQILCRGMREGLERKVLPLKTSHVTGYGRCEQLFTLFFGFYKNVKMGRSARHKGLPGLA